MKGLLRVEGLTVRFGGLTALDKAGFELAAGEIVGLIGPNGAGKTTLFSALSGLVRQQSGTVWLDGVRIDGLRPHAIARRGMTKTFQNTALFPDMTVFDNVMSAAVIGQSVKQARALSEACLARAGLGDLAGANISSLTFPQRALTEIARALATRPRILLLDEVMAALNPAEMDAVMGNLRRLAREDGMTLVIVEHHMRAIMNLCARILVLDFGRLIAEGTPAAIAANPLVIAAYLGQPPGAKAGHVRNA